MSETLIINDQLKQDVQKKIDSSNESRNRILEIGQQLLPMLQQLKDLKQREPLRKGARYNMLKKRIEILEHILVRIDEVKTNHSNANELEKWVDLVIEGIGLIETDISEVTGTMEETDPNRGYFQDFLPLLDEYRDELKTAQTEDSRLFGSDTALNVREDLEYDVFNAGKARSEQDLVKSTGIFDENKKLLRDLLLGVLRGAVAIRDNSEKWKGSSHDLVEDYLEIFEKEVDLQHEIDHRLKELNIETDTTDIEAEFTEKMRKEVVALRDVLKGLSRKQDNARIASKTERGKFNDTVFGESGLLDQEERRKDEEKLKKIEEAIANDKKLTELQSQVDACRKLQEGILDQLRIVVETRARAEQTLSYVDPRSEKATDQVNSSTIDFLERIKFNPGINGLRSLHKVDPTALEITEVAERLGINGVFGRFLKIANKYESDSENVSEAASQAPVDQTISETGDSDDTLEPSPPVKPTEGPTEKEANESPVAQMDEVSEAPSTMEEDESSAEEAGSAVETDSTDSTETPGEDNPNETKAPEYTQPGAATAASEAPADKNEEENEDEEEEQDDKGDVENKGDEDKKGPSATPGA